jgi:hypothetical protein
MSVSTEIIEKIKKLLRLSRSSNPHEAQLALARALELARQHGVAVEGLNPDEQAKEKAVTHRDSEPVRRMSYDARYAATICQRFFRINAVERAKLTMVDGWPMRVVYLMFVGTESDVEIALYVYNFLKHHFSYCWRKHRGRLRNRHAFVYGMTQGIFAKLLDAEPPAQPIEVKGNELAIDARRHYITALVGETVRKEWNPPSADAKAATWAGFVHGQKTSILNPLKEGERTTPLALK